MNRGNVIIVRPLADPRACELVYFFSILPNYLTLRINFVHYTSQRQRVKVLFVREGDFIDGLDVFRNHLHTVVQLQCRLDV